MSPFLKFNPLNKKSRPVSLLLTRTALNATKRFLPSQPHPFITNHSKIKLTPFYTQHCLVSTFAGIIYFIKTRTARQVDAEIWLWRKDNYSATDPHIPNANYLVFIRKRSFSALAASICGLLVRRTGVRLRATPYFPCQDEKILVPELKTTSFSSGVSRWKLFNPAVHERTDLFISQINSLRTLAKIFNVLHFSHFDAKPLTRLRYGGIPNSAPTASAEDFR